MKIKLFIPFLAGIFIAGLSDSRGEVPSGTTPVDDSIRSLSQAVVFNSAMLVSDLAVNEKEVRAGLLYDVVNQKIVWQKNATTPYPIASLTKMMVALLAVEDVRAGKFAWTDNIKWTRETIVGRKHNRKKVYTEVSYSLRDAFKAAMIASNNECTEQMARFLGNGNLAATIERMNARAVELGMLNTYYGNPTGLPAAHAMFDNRSTPTDQLIISLEMLKYSEVIEIASMGYAEIENGKKSSVIHNHNKLTIDYSGDVDGLKTGYTRRAGFCLAATTAKCDHRLISIVLGCRGPAIRNEIVRDMFNDYYSGIGLDKLGPDRKDQEGNIARSGNESGKYVTVYEPVRKVHVVRGGENLSLIAQKYKCTTSQLRSWNKGKLKGSTIYSGQKIVLHVKQPRRIFIADPANGGEAEDDKPLLTDAEKKEIKDAELATGSPATTINSDQANANYLYHTIAPGDTLFNIAQRYDGVSVAELKALNKITDTRTLLPGTKIKVKVQS